MDVLLFLVFILLPLSGLLLLIIIIYSWLKVLGLNRDTKSLRRELVSIQKKLMQISKNSDLKLQGQSEKPITSFTPIQSTPKSSSSTVPRTTQNQDNKQSLSTEKKHSAPLSHEPVKPTDNEPSLSDNIETGQSKPPSAKQKHSAGVTNTPSQSASQAASTLRYESLADNEPSPAWEWIKENWTGFLGVAAVVLGVAFAATYVGYFASALIRFMMIVAIGITFVGVSVSLRKLASWRELGAWLQAGGGAILLLAFLGGAYFEGLRFYETASQGFTLMVIGLGLNLGLAFYKPQQALSASHVVLSLLAISVAPSTVAMVWVGALVTVVGVCLSHAKQWNLNLAACLIAYSIFTMILGAFHDPMLHWHGIAAAMFVFVPSLLVHYRNLYHDESDVKMSVSVHIVAWSLFGFNLFLYQQGVAWVSVPLGLGALAALALALYASSQRIRWLFTIDFLVGELLLGLTLIALSRLSVQAELIIWMLTIQMISLTFVAIRFNWRTIIKVNLSLAGFSLFCFLLSSFHDESRHATTMLATVLIILYSGYHMVQAWLQGDGSDHDSITIVHHALNLFMFATAIIMILIGIKSQISGLYWATAIVWIALSFNPVLFKQAIHRAWSLSFLASVIGFSVLLILGTSDPSQILKTDLMMIYIPMMLAGGSTFRGKLLKTQANQWFIQYGCYGLGFLSLAMIWKLDAVNAFLPGLLALVVSAVLVEGRRFLAHSSDEKYQIMNVAISNIGICALLAFAVFFGIDIIHSQLTVLGIFSIRVLVILLGLTVACMWMLTKPIKNPVEQTVIPPSLGFDMSAALLITLNVLELDTPLHGIGYTAIGLLFVMMRHSSLPDRRYIYGFGLLLATLIHVPIVSSSWASPLSSWYDTSHVTGPIALLMACGLATALCRIDFRSSDMSSPVLDGVNEMVHIDKPLLTYVPIFISLALFLLWRFDGAVLTALWVGEVFTMVLLGIYIRHQSVIRVAYGFLILCLARLVFHDFSQSDLLMKAFVFVVVGLLMIAMHITYKKLKGRLE